MPESLGYNRRMSTYDSTVVTCLPEQETILSSEYNCRKCHKTVVFVHDDCAAQVRIQLQYIIILNLINYCVYKMKTAFTN